MPILESLEEYDDYDDIYTAVPQRRSATQTSIPPIRRGIPHSALVVPTFRRRKYVSSSLILFICGTALAVAIIETINFIDAAPKNRNLLDYLTNNLSIIFYIALLLIIALASVNQIGYLLERRSSKNTKRYNIIEDEKYENSYEGRPSIVRRYNSRPATQRPLSRIEEIIITKKQKFLDEPSISFHFANHEQIRDFYDQYFKEPTIESLVSEITGEVDGSVSGKIPQVIEAGISGKDISKWISNIKLPNLSSSEMFLRFQRETINKEQVTLGIEEVDIELNGLRMFDENIKNFKRRFDLEFDETMINNKRVSLREKAAERTLSKLENVSGWVLVEGKFKIDRDGDFYRFIYTHPVNKYLSEQIGPVTISIILSIKSFEENIKGNYAQSIGSSIPLKIYGKVWRPIDRVNKIWDMQINALAVYQ